MLGYADKRVCVRFTQRQFNEFSELLSSPRFPVYFGERTWSKLVRWALSELQKQEKAAAAAAAWSQPKKPIKSVAAVKELADIFTGASKAIRAGTPKKAKAV